MRPSIAMSPPRPLATIQALRGVAAAMIVVLHGFFEAGLPKPAFPLHLGVEIFFVISGFIMVHTSRDAFGRADAWPDFARRRLIRIVPTYWFFTTLLLGMALAFPSALQTARPEPGHLALSYLFVPHHAPAGHLHPFLELGWTLNYEMLFYAVFAALLVLPMRRSLAALTGVFACAVIAGRWIPTAYAAPHFWTRPVVLCFVAGAWLGAVHAGGRRMPGWLALGTAAIAAILLGIAAAPGPHVAWTRQACAVLVVALATLPRRAEDTPMPRVLQRLGDASYTTYLAHPFILAGAMLALRGVPAAMRCVVGIGAALAVSYLLHRVVERPLIALVSRVGGGAAARRTSRAAAPASEAA
jgi:peptidoglycan/LPS O-acetylase OafA/YrhL